MAATPSIHPECVIGTRKGLPTNRFMPPTGRRALFAKDMDNDVKERSIRVNG